MTEKLDPQALAQLEDGDDRDGVQEVTAELIRDYVMEAHGLPEVSARALGNWLYEYWFDNVDPERIPPMTNGQVIAGAVSYWTGGTA